jgi:hypothetical protein
VTIIAYNPKKVKDIIATLKESGANTLCIIPLAYKDKFNIIIELVTISKKATILNICLISFTNANIVDAKK